MLKFRPGGPHQRRPGPQASSRRRCRRRCRRRRRPGQRGWGPLGRPRQRRLGPQASSRRRRRRAVCLRTSPLTPPRSRACGRWSPSTVSRTTSPRSPTSRPTPCARRSPTASKPWAAAVGPRLAALVDALPRGAPLTHGTVRAEPWVQFLGRPPPTLRSFVQSHLQPAFAITLLEKASSTLVLSCKPAYARALCGDMANATVYVQHTAEPPPAALACCTRPAGSKRAGPHSAATTPSLLARGTGRHRETAARREQHQQKASCGPFDWPAGDCTRHVVTAYRMRGNLAVSPQVSALWGVFVLHAHTARGPQGTPTNGRRASGGRADVRHLRCREVCARRTEGPKPGGRFGVRG
jgi:hypothetical protein